MDADGLAVVLEQVARAVVLDDFDLDPIPAVAVEGDGARAADFVRVVL